MVPVLPPGTLVVGWRYFGKIKPQQVVIVKHDNKEKIKRVTQINENEIFLLGDHQETSTDSRHFGWLPIENIHARVIWPRTNP